MKPTQPDLPAAPRTIGLVIKSDPEVHRKADAFESWLREKDIGVVRGVGLSQADENLPASCRKTAPSNLFCVFVLGGDGTFLSAARWIGHHPIPLIGVKFGNVGFLAETPAEALFTTAEMVLEGQFDITRRMRLEIQVMRDGQALFHDVALNDIVVSRGALARLARFKTYVDEHYLTTFRSDGLIISTPTGSTAYCLAAGGPIIHPVVTAMVLTPICPFTLTNRPLIVPDTATLTVRLDQGDSEVLLTVDGQAGMELAENDLILIRKSPYFLNMIILPDWDYFDILRNKLGWRGGAL